MANKCKIQRNSNGDVINVEVEQRIAPSVIRYLEDLEMIRNGRLEQEAAKTKEPNILNTRTPVGIIQGLITRLQDTALSDEVVILNSEGIEATLSGLGSEARKSVRMLDGSVWKSTAIEGLSKITQKNATPDQWVKMIADKGGRGTSQELEWVGLSEYLDAYQKENNLKSIPKEVVEEYLEHNQIEVVEVTKGGDIKAQDNVKTRDAFYDQASEELSLIDANTEENSGILDKWYDNPTTENFNEVREMLERENVDIAPIEDYARVDAGIDTKYEEYTLSGGDNYREILLILPKDNVESEKDNYGSDHWDELNILAHLRIKERTLEVANPNYRDPSEIKLDFDESFNLIDKGTHYDVQKKSTGVTYGSSYSKARMAELGFSEQDLKDYLMTRDLKYSHDNIRDYNSRILANKETITERVLFVEEVQSDWAQEGKQRGFRGKGSLTEERENSVREFETKMAELKALGEQLDSIEELSEEEQTRIRREIRKYEELLDTVTNNREFNEYLAEIKTLEDRLEAPSRERDRVQEEINVVGEEVKRLLDETSQLVRDDAALREVGDMPYKKTDQWVGMAMRRVMQMATQEGFDRIAWVTGEQSADRYKLTRYIEALDVEAENSNEKGWRIQFTDKQGNKETGYTRDNDLEATVGKEMAERIREDGGGYYEGLGLEAGGEGMKAFYNSIMPKVTLKEAKRFDKKAKIEVIDFGGTTEKDPGKQLSIKLTPKAKQNLSQAIPLFQKSGRGVNGFVHDNKVYLNTDNLNIETPIHEFGHLYNTWLKESHPEKYQIGINLVKAELSKTNSEIQSAIDYVKATQPNLQGEALHEEILTQVVGRTGVDIINSRSDSKIANWLRDVWESIKNMLGLADMTVEQASKLNIGEYAQAIATDLLRGEQLDRGDRVINGPGTTQADLKQFFDNEEFAILTAENPNNVEHSKEENKVFNQRLEEYLNERGIGFERVAGMYGGTTESSYLIPGMTSQQALEVARVFNQESILHTLGYVYQDGTYNPRTGEDVYGDVGSDNYSIINGHKFSLGLDFDQRLPLPVEESSENNAYSEVEPADRPGFNEGIQEVAQIADEYKKKYKIKNTSHQPVLALEEEVSKDMADAYENGNFETDQAKIDESYKALIEETKQQYEFIVENGLKVERYLGEGEPYRNSKEMLRDVRENNTLKFLSTEVAYGNEASDTTDNIGLQKSGYKLEDGHEMTNSELFRVVHDYFGHGILGSQFGAIGEENATLQHLGMFSDKAAPALIFLTRGQNSWVNFSGANNAAKVKFKEARQARREGREEEANILHEEGMSLFRFAEPIISLFKNIYNFKFYDTARRIKEQKRINTINAPTDNDLSSYLQETSGDSAVTGGFRLTDKQGVTKIGGTDVVYIREYIFDESVDASLKKAFPDFKGTQKIYEITDGALYKELMEKALKDNPFRASVTVHEAQEFEKMRMFITEDGSTGITLTSEGFLGGGFSDKRANRPNNLSQLMVIGIREGAITAEAFDTVLPDYYSQFGFKAVSRTAFNDEYKPMEATGALADWDFETYKNFNGGRPDVVFFIYDGGDRTTIEDRIGQFDGYNSYEKENTQYFDKNSYDKAERVMQEEAIKRGIFEKQQRGEKFQLADTQEQGVQTEVSRILTPVIERLTKTGMAKGVETLNTNQIIERLKDFTNKSIGKDRVKGLVTPDDKVIFNRDTMTLDTPIHEFGHLWIKNIKTQSPELYNQGLKLIEEQGAEYLAIVDKTQPWLKGNDRLEEALAQAIGDSGAKIIESQKVEEFSEWLNKLWEWVGSQLGISAYVSIGKVKDLTLDQFSTAIAIDLLKTKPTGELVHKNDYGDNNVSIEVNYIEESKKESLILNNRLRIEKNLDFIQGLHIVTHGPDNMFTGEMIINNKKTGEVKVIEGNGGVYFVTKFGDVWATGAAISQSGLINAINEQLERNIKEGKGNKTYLALSSANPEKLKSNTQGVRAIVALMESIMDAGHISSQDFKDSFIQGVDEFHRKLEVDAARKGKEYQRSEFIFPENIEPSGYSDFVTKYFEDPTKDTFAMRGNLVQDILQKMTTKPSFKENASKIREFLRLSPSKSLPGKDFKRAISDLAVEQMLQGLPPYHIYALIEITAPVFAKESGHGAYPFSVGMGSQDNLIAPKLIILENPEHASDVINPAKSNEDNYISYDSSPLGKDKFANSNILGGTRQINKGVVKDKNTQFSIEDPSIAKNYSGKAIYSAIFTNKEELIERYTPQHSNVYAHHSTIEFRPKQVLQKDIGTIHQLKVTGRLVTDKVDALLVDNPRSANEYPHITLAVAEGVKPFESNAEIAQNLDQVQPLDDTIDGVFGVFDGKADVTTNSVRFSIQPEEDSGTLRYGDSTLEYGPRYSPITGARTGETELKNIKTPEASRGQGMARKLMEMFIEKMDDEGRTAYLMISPGDASTSADRLAGFYKEYGFREKSGMFIGEMTRRPKTRTVRKTSETAKEFIKQPFLTQEESLGAYANIYDSVDEWENLNCR